MEISSQYALAYCLTSTAGIRVFLTLTALSAASHFGYLTLAPKFAWLGSSGALSIFAVMSVVELLADKIPLVDHLLHGLQTVVKPIAGAVIMTSVSDPTSAGATAAFAAFGGANALGIHSLVALTRGASTATTLGVGNHLLSFIEDAMAVVALITMWFAPVVIAIAILVVTILTALLVRRVAAAVRARRARSA